MNLFNSFMINSYANVLEDFWKQIYEYWFGTGKYIYTFIFAIVWLIASIFLAKIILRLIRKGMKITKRGEKTAKSFLLDVIKVVLYFIIFIVFLLVLGVEMSGMTTVFSSAILAIGLSLQSVVGNFASGMIILANKPFVIGDYIVIPGVTEGTVIDVKFLSTILETVNGQKVTVTNSSVVGSVVENYSVNSIRRLVINLNFSYNENSEDIRKAILEIIKKDAIILKEPKAKVVITSLDTTGVTYSLRCYTKTEDYWDVFYDINEKIVLKLQEKKLKVQPNKVQLISSDIVRSGEYAKDHK